MDKKAIIVNFSVGRTKREKILQVNIARFELHPERITRILNVLMEYDASDNEHPIAKWEEYVRSERIDIQRHAVVGIDRYYIQESKKWGITINAIGHNEIITFFDKKNECYRVYSSLFSWVFGETLEVDTNS